MKYIKPTKKTEKVINELVEVGNLAKQCKTKEELEGVKEIFNSKIDTLTFSKQDIKSAYFHLGIVEGIILSIEKLKFT